MPRIERTDHAEQDLISIWTYLGESSPRTADRVLDQINAVCKLLARMPFVGRVRPELGSGALRTFLVGDYLIVYHPKKSGIVIVRVLNGCRDLDSLFS